MSTDVERANELLRTWVGRTCEAFRREGDWLFVFSHGGSAPAPERPPDHADVAVWCAWRLIAEGRKRLFGRDINRRIVRCSGDDGHQFGHPAPVDAQAEAQKVIGESRVATVTIDAVTNDLEITFETGTVLQIVSNSAGYEAWYATGMRPDGVMEDVVATGGGLAFFESSLPTAES